MSISRGNYHFTTLQINFVEVQLYPIQNSKITSEFIQDSSDYPPSNHSRCSISNLKECC